MSQVERRGAVRIPARLAMEIALDSTAERVESLNVSASGVYFTSPTFIEPLTRVQITLALPDGDPPGSTHDVRCDGVVVRTVPEAPDPSVDRYEIACCFTMVSDRERLEAYILSHVPF